MATTLLPDQNVTVTAGGSASFDVDLQTVDGEAPDCTGFLARYVATRVATETVHIDKDLSSGLSWVSASRLRVTLTADDLPATLGGLNLLHEVVVYDTLGNPAHAMRGALIVRKSYV